jgi:DNA processing protein
MSAASETVALVAVLRSAKRPVIQYADLVEDAGSATAILNDEQGLLAPQLLEAAEGEIAGWQGAGIELLTVLDPDFPANLRAVHDRPAVVFVAGRLEPRDARAVAVIGTRRPSPIGVETAKVVAARLVEAGYAVVSGLAAGIDTAAHTAALDRRGRTIAVIGTGLLRCYPPQNAALQSAIAAEGAVVSQFWPDAPPTKRSFPQRNAVMSGLSLATVVVEAGQTSGARTQARLALAHGRPVLLMESLLEQPWASELAGRPGTWVIRSPDEVPATVDRLSSTDSLVG